MNFQPQPYPLFVAFYGLDDKVKTGRIIGWAVPDDNNSSSLQPLAVLDEPHGVTEPKYLEFEHEQHALGESISEACAALSLAS
ncbi:MAG: hypothetical protein ABW022_14845 [Actinoplanes sp.]